MTDFDKNTTTPAPLTLEGIVRARLRVGEEVYGVVDAARDVDLFTPAGSTFGLHTSTLFDGPLAQHLDHVAPHLVSIDLDSGYIDLWRESLGRSAGILLITVADADELWHHLRRVFEVCDEDGNEYTFRYYDPRVLRTYLLTCTSGQAQEFLGPIRQILVESQRPGALLCCRAGRTRLVMDELPLGDAP